MTEDALQFTGGRPLFDTGKADADKAQALFPNQGFHTAARYFAFAHSRAVQYLEQAPVLVYGANTRGVGVPRMNQLYIAHKLAPLCQRGAPLKDVMRAYDLAPPLRKLKASALFPSAGRVIAELSRLDPALLGRVIPDAAGPQKAWLSALVEWRRGVAGRGQPTEYLFAWAADNLAASKVKGREVGQVVDFATAPGETFNPAWRWPRANEEAIRWHTRLTMERMLKGSPFKADTPVDLGAHPDEAHNDGYSFYALRTPKALFEEGAAMHHCVASYLNAVVAGRCHIISIRKGLDRVATLELSKPKWAVNQLKGRFNATPPVEIALAAQNYANELCRT